MSDRAPLRVAHVIETLGVGGAERLVAEVVRRLDRQRFHSRVFPLDEPLDLQGEIEAEGTVVDPVLAPPRRRPLACLRRLARKLRRFGPGLVHTHLYYGNVMGRIASRLAGGAPVVTTLHNPDYTFEARPTMLFRGRKLVDRVTGSRNAAIVAVSRAVAEDFHRHMGWENIRVVPNGVDLQAFAPGGDDRAMAEWPSAGQRLLSVGRLHPQKGHRVLLDAMAGARQAGAQLSLLVAGEGAERAALEAQASALGLQGHVRLAGRRDVRPLLAAADVFVFPSLYEAVGIALLEAMACARPVVASRTGGIPDVVEDGVSGMLITPGDALGLAGALAALERDPELRRTLGKAARARAEAFDIRTTVHSLEVLYEEVARG
jgi:glycosyltransferase involved in cell wall biosynthesis